MDAVDLFKCLSDPTRLRISLLLTQEGELCVCELTEALGLLQPKISRHLAFLRHQQVLDTRRQGQWMYYRLADSLPEWAKQILQSVQGESGLSAGDDVRRLSAMSDRPEVRPSCC